MSGACRASTQGDSAVKNKPLKSRNQFFGRWGEKHNKRLGEREERAGRIFFCGGGGGGSGGAV